MGNFFTDVIQRDRRYLSVEPVNEIALLEPGFRRKAQGVVDAAFARGIQLESVETYRSSKRQQRLFDEGKTQLRTVGVHHYGLALDFAKIVNGRLTWDGDWSFMAELAVAAGVVSGYDWGLPDKPHSFRDPGHLQGVTLAEQRDLFAGTWYPGAGESVGTLAPVPIVVTVPGAVPAIPAGLPSDQAKILALADQINAESFGGWFARASIMAFVEVESEFNEYAIRHEPSGVTSYGIMQVLDSTAAGLGLVGDPEQMYDPAVSLFYGMKYAAGGWNYLTTHFGRPPTLGEWSDGYNEGYGAAAKGRDVPYSDKWTVAYDRWTVLLADTTAVRPVAVERRKALRRTSDRAAYAAWAAGQLPSEGQPDVESDPGESSDETETGPTAEDTSADELNREELARITGDDDARGTGTKV